MVSVKGVKPRCFGHVCLKFVFFPLRFKGCSSPVILFGSYSQERPKVLLFVWARVCVTVVESGGLI